MECNMWLLFAAARAKIPLTKDRIFHREEHGMDYSVLDFGARGNGSADDTAAIQAAIDACASSGGGRVVLPGGRTFRSGALVLRSRIEFHLEMGAVLKGSDRLSDYLLFGGSAPEKMEVPSYENCEYTGMPTHYFLYARGCEGLAITGLGRIDGNEEIFYGEATRWHIEGSFYPRAPLLFLENVSHLTIRDVTLAASAFWTVHMVGCRDVLIDGVRILNNLKMANCDGIDPDHCQNVRIANCHIECADDCIVFKNTAHAMRYGPCENITVTNCTLTSTSAAIKFGSESEDDFRNILVENCVISRSNRGISLQLRDRGRIENVSFQNLAIETRLFHPEVYWGNAEPIAVTVLRRKEETELGAVRDVRFSNIFCTAENGILLYAEEPGAISGLRFDGVSLRLRRATDYEMGVHDLRPCAGPPSAKGGDCWVYVKNVFDTAFRNGSFRADASMGPPPDAPCRCEGCEGFRLEEG